MIIIFSLGRSHVEEGRRGSVWDICALKNYYAKMSRLNTSNIIKRAPIQQQHDDIDSSTTSIIEIIYIFCTN